MRKKIVKKKTPPVDKIIDKKPKDDKSRPNKEDITGIDVGTTIDLDVKPSKKNNDEEQLGLF